MGAAAADLRRLADGLEEIPTAGLIAAAKAAKTIVKQEGAKVAGADGMKGNKRRGLKLTARDTIRQTDQGATVRIQGSVPAWIWANTGTDPHRIRRRKRGPMRVMTVQHPGTPPRRAWDRVAERVTDLVPRIFADELGQAVNR